MDTPSFVIRGFPCFHKDISVVVPPISRATVCPNVALRNASRPSTVAAGPVNTVSTGTEAIVSIGNEPPSAFNIYTGAVILCATNASRTACLKRLNTSVTALLK